MYDSSQRVWDYCLILYCLAVSLGNNFIINSMAQISGSNLGIRVESKRPQPNASDFLHQSEMNLKFRYGISTNNTCSLIHCYSLMGCFFPHFFWHLYLVCHGFGIYRKRIDMCMGRMEKKYFVGYNDSLAFLKQESFRDFPLNLFF